jgi:hypothetical protein
MSSPTLIKFTIRFTSRLDTNQTVVLEPWTGEYRLGAGQQLDVVVEGTPKTALEIEIESDRIVVSGFDTTDAMLTAFRGGKELRSEHEKSE